MVDRPYSADEARLQFIKKTFGERQVYPMTETGERGLAYQMEIVPGSTHLLRNMPSMKSMATYTPLRPYLVKPPTPKLRLGWYDKRRVWGSEFDMVNELPLEIRRVIERTGYGCLAGY